MTMAGGGLLRLRARPQCLFRGIAFVSILVAAITSTFVARAERERERADAPAS
jgi:hypothetical protein